MRERERERERGYFHMGLFLLPLHSVVAFVQLVVALPDTVHGCKYASGWVDGEVDDDLGVGVLGL